MALGKAFIEVHADTAPFARELGRDLNRILRQAESDIQARSTRLGESIAEHAGRGLNRNSNQLTQGVRRALSPDEGRNVGARFAGGIIDAIDDGFSGLPAEVKVALGGLLAATAPFIAATISSAISLGVIAGFAGLGILVGSQFQVVQTEFEALGNFLREFFVDIGNVFVSPILRAFDLIRTRTLAMEGWFQEVFAASAAFIEPLADAFAAFVEGLLPGLLDTLRNVTPLTDELVDVARELGVIFGTALRVISGTDDAAEGLRVLVISIGAIVVGTAAAIRVLTEFFGLLTDISQLLTDPAAWALDQTLDAQAQAAKNAASANGTYEQSLKNLIAPTEAQEKATKAIQVALQNYLNAAIASRHANIGFEQSLDDMTKELTDGTRELDINSQAGRDNQLSILNAAEALIKQRDETIKLTGETTTANATFDTNRKRLEDAAFAAGISRQKFRELTGAILNVPSTVDITVPTGSINNAISRIGVLIGQAIRASTAIAGATAGTGRGGGGSAQAHAHGGVFTQPHIGMVAEAGPEAIIPLSNPGRAAQVMNEAGLSSMLSPNINVYIGNRQIDAYIDTRVNQRMTTTARDLAYGGRGI